MGNMESRESSTEGAEDSAHQLFSISDESSSLSGPLHVNDEEAYDFEKKLGSIENTPAECVKAGSNSSSSKSLTLNPQRDSPKPGRNHMHRMDHVTLERKGSKRNVIAGVHSNSSLQKTLAMNSQPLATKGQNSFRNQEALASMPFPRSDPIRRYVTSYHLCIMPIRIMTLLTYNTYIPRPPLSLEMHSTLFRHHLIPSSCITKK